MRRNHSRLAWAALLVALGLGSQAHASVNGNIAGVVTDEENGKPLAGVTVTATSPALQGEQTEFTDAGGRYIITELPPGEYTVRFYFSNLKVERTGVFINADKTLQVNAAMPTRAAKTQTYHVTEKASSVDVGNTQIQTQVTNDLVRNTPVRGRGYESVLTLAPGAAADTGNPGNFSFNGATGPENNFLIDGMNTTNPSFGLMGTRLSLEFINETEIITGGYNAEYGRATGGVVNVVTKSGSNEFHGGAWFFYQPMSLDPQRVARTGEAIARQSKVDHAFDFGFDVGGPIVKDRIWFYAGFHPQFETDTNLRILRRRTADDANGTNAPAGGTYYGDLDSSLTCPSYLADKSLCPAPNAATGPFRTVDLDSKNWTTYTSNSRLYNYIAKLNFALNENNSLSVEYIGAPSSFDGALNNPLDPNLLSAGSAGFNASSDGIPYKETIQVHDVSVHLISKLLDHKLQADVLAGFHYESYSIEPGPTGDQTQIIDNRASSLSRYESLPDCMPTTVGNGATFNPCPVQGYSDGGRGLVNSLTNERWSVQAGLTYFLKLAGTHALKLGGDFEDNMYTDSVRFTGHNDDGRVTIYGDNSVNRFQFATQNTDGSTKVLDDGLTSSTSVLNYSLYLRDSWNVGFLPGLTINAGVRWEAQQVQDVNGATQIGIYDNIAPRVGFVYDWTNKGRAKIYANYGRYYESIPADLADRSFSGEGFAVGNMIHPNAMGGIPTDPMAAGGNCNVDANGRVIGGAGGGAPCNFVNPAHPVGGAFAKVAPGLQGQYSNEVVAGVQYDVGFDLVLGAAYVHRDLGNIIEDMSPDGGYNYLIANPGAAPDPGQLAQLQTQINSINKQLSNPKLDAATANTLRSQLSDAQTTLSLYKAQSQFERPRRDYNAVVLTANKRFSRHFVVLASYTYSRTLGNYPGLFQASNGQVDPNISTQYDLRELLINRDGPLPDDRPHNIKVTGAYEIPVGDGSVTLGLTFDGLSGLPIEVIGGNPYGPNETFILPRGSGGRTPFITQFDTHVGYGRNLGRGLRLEMTWDVFNVFNEQAVTEIDDLYSYDNVAPIKNGTVADLRNLKNFNGSQPNLNPNYGQPIAYQLPLSMRFGLRVSF